VESGHARNANSRDGIEGSPTTGKRRSCRRPSYSERLRCGARKELECQFGYAIQLPGGTAFRQRSNETRGLCYARGRLPNAYPSRSPFSEIGLEAVWQPNDAD